MMLREGREKHSKKPRPIFRLSEKIFNPPIPAANTFWVPICLSPSAVSPLSFPHVPHWFQQPYSYQPASSSAPLWLNKCRVLEAQATLSWLGAVKGANPLVESCQGFSSQGGWKKKGQTKHVLLGHQESMFCSSVFYVVDRIQVRKRNSIIPILGSTCKYTLQTMVRAMMVNICLHNANFITWGITRMLISDSESIKMFPEQGTQPSCMSKERKISCLKWLGEYIIRLQSPSNPLPSRTPSPAPVLSLLE